MPDFQNTQFHGGIPLRKLFLGAVLGAALLVPSAPLPANAGSFNPTWLESLRQEARNGGVDQKTIDRVLPLNMVAPPQVNANLHNQPEVVRKVTLADYLRPRLSPARIAKGRAMMQRHANKLQAVSQQYGVSPQYIVSIWALESNFGENMGDIPIVPALVTLARDHPKPDRRAYFRAEALEAVRLIAAGNTEIEHNGGSWAGAMGHTQFMPTSFHRFAVDGDGDGHKDIWNNLTDVFASTSNYLVQNDWQPGQRWGREVVLPQGFDRHLLTDTLKAQVNKTPAQWAALGVRSMEGPVMPSENIPAMLIAPDYNPKTDSVVKGRVFMVYNNFKTIMRYNSSYKYALSVSLLADEIASAAPAPSTTPDFNP